LGERRSSEEILTFQEANCKLGRREPGEVYAFFFWDVRAEGDRRSVKETGNVGEEKKVSSKSQYAGVYRRASKREGGRWGGG